MLTLGCVLVVLTMITSCFVLVPGARAFEEEDEEALMTPGSGSVYPPPLDGSGIIRFDPIIFNQYIPFLYLSLMSSEVRPASMTPLMIVMVESGLYSDLSDELERYADDVERTGLGVSIWTVSSLADPDDIKEILTDAYDASPLYGCLMVGDVTAAMYHIDTVWGDGSADVEDFPCDLFYMDMDGTWGYDAAISMYDSHTDGAGDVEPEIWVGRLRTDRMLGDEVQMLEDYFDKNHAYRTGALTFPDKALTYVDDDWAPGTYVSDSISLAFSDNTIVNNKATTARVDYLDELNESYAMVHVMCHGSPSGQGFKVPDPSDPPNSMWEPGGDISGVNDIRLIDDNVMFYNLFVCSSARFTEANYLAGWYVQSGDTLVAVGSAKTGSMINDLEFYDPISDGFSVGNAFREWFDDTLTKWSDSVPWTMGMTIIGDPTIRMVGPHEVNIETTGLPNTIYLGSVHYTLNGVASWGSIFMDGTWSGQCDHGTMVTVDDQFKDFGRTYNTYDQTEFMVVEPLNVKIDYVEQCLVEISEVGIPFLSFSHAVRVEFFQGGVHMAMAAWEGHPFSEYCDNGTIVTAESVVDIDDDERYATEDPTEWEVNGPIQAELHYFHQFEVLVEVATIGLNDLSPSNSVPTDYTMFGKPMTENLHQYHELLEWVDADTYIYPQLLSTGSDSLHRWCGVVFWIQVEKNLRMVLDYYEQYLMELKSDGLMSVLYQATVNYTQFGIVTHDQFYDGAPWSDWADNWNDTKGMYTTLSWSKIVLGPPCQRYHTLPPTGMAVVTSTSKTIFYHLEYKVTIKAEGLPDTQTSTVTVAVADPSPTDLIPGGDETDYMIELSSANSFTWHNWVHAGTELTATSSINVDPSEKYIMICWSVGASRYAPPSIDADWPCLTYTAHYVGLKKEMSLDEAGLTSPVMVHLQVSMTSIIDQDDVVTLVDDLPNEFSFVVGSTKDNGATISPTLTNVMVSPYHQRLTFKLGPGDHDIWFEVRVNRAYIADRTVKNVASATFDLEGLDPMSLGVEDQLVIHPYIGPTFSVRKSGPDVVPWRTNCSWELTFIVKDNYAYKMKGALVKDCFGPEIKYLANSVMANLVTKPCFTISGCPTKQVGMSWNVGDVQVGEAFMLQVTIYTTDKGICGGQGFTMLNQNPLDFGASLRFTNCNNNLVTLTALPLWVKAIKPI